MGIGSIVTTQSGLAVVVETLPTRLIDGSLRLSQVIVAPLNGGGAPFTPIAEQGTVTAIIDQLLAQEAAALFVTSVLDAPLPPIEVPGEMRNRTFTGGPPPGDATLLVDQEFSEHTAAALTATNRAIANAAALAIEKTQHITFVG